MKINHYKKKSNWQEAKSWSISLSLSATWGTDAPTGTPGIFESYSWGRNNRPNRFSRNFNGTYNSHESIHEIPL